jgi:hypothetical protein
MKQTEKNIATVIGLDVGTSRLVTAQRVDGDFRYQAQLNAFVNIPFSKLTENVLKKENVPHSVVGSDIVVHGNESERFADLLHVETRRPMTRGVLNPGEPDGLSRMRQIIATMIGDEGKEGQKVCFSVPAAPLGEEENLTYHEASLRQIIGELGYEAKSVNEGLAVIYSELESSNYSGIGISCGGGLCNVALAYLSVPVVSFSIPKAGDFIDASAAAVTGEVGTRIRIAKEAGFYFNGQFTDKVQQVLSVYYDDMIQTLVTALKDAFTNSRNLPRMGKPIPLVLSGGSAMPKGFRERFETILKKSDFPIQLSEVRLAENPLYATAKGALVAGLAEM